MKQVVAAVATLALVVSGVVLATSMTSSAQESGDDTATTTTTVPDDDVRGFFDFRFHGDLPPKLEELNSCLAEQGIEIPEDADRPFHFELRGTEGLAEALEACGLPGPGNGFLFDGELPEGFPFDGELPEGFPFGGGLHRFPFDGELPEGFPFDGELPEGFTFGGGFHGFPFDGEFPEGFTFGGPSEGFGFGFGAELLDRDALAGCLAELGSFENVDEVRAQLDECLPDHPMGGEFGFSKRPGGRGFGGWFDFDLEDVAPEGADASA
ncbi:MAG: hypothetical protein OER12_05790 [Acidimicrobiia bacterium]|nr:hypothetical protein [Acidimicrobiia bacterium]